MIPDKIYLKGFSGNISQIWSRIKATETSADVQYEYIRKDALIEWLKAKRAPFMGDNDYGKGNIDALDEVIDKLNEI